MTKHFSHISEPVIRSVEMSVEMQKTAKEVGVQARVKFQKASDVAEYIQKEFTRKYGESWHCVVGLNFGAYVTHFFNHYIIFSLGDLNILLFRTLL